MATKKRPGVSYRAESDIRTLRINVISTDGGTSMNIYWSERRFGDEPLQGHMWTLEADSPKQVSTLLHATNLAGWLVRQALAGRWEKRR